MAEVSLTGGPQHRPSESELAIGVESFWHVEDRGFLPYTDPVKDLPRPWNVLVELAELLPSLCVRGQLFREHLNSVARESLPGTKEEISKALAKLSEGQLECLHSILSYLCLAYLRCFPDIYEEDVKEKTQNLILEKAPEIDVLPSCLALPWLLVSRRIDRKPMLDYAGCVLNNWERIDSFGPISPQNVRMLRRFTGLVDEEWFFKTHVIIESEGSHIVSSVVQCCKAIEAKNFKSLARALKDLEEAIFRVATICMPIMYDRLPDNNNLACEPYMFYARLRPFIKSLSLKFDVPEDFDETTDSDVHFLHGPSGAMSSLMPTVDAALGIKNTAPMLVEAVQNFEAYAPKSHREFVQKLREAPMSIRDFIESNRYTLDELSWFALARTFNSVVSRVLDFRWRHLNFVSFFVIKPATGGGGLPSGGSCPVNLGNETSVPKPKNIVGTGGTSFGYLQQHITDTEKAKIILDLDDHASTFASVPMSRMQSWNGPSPGTRFWEVNSETGFLPTISVPLWDSEADAPVPALWALQLLVWQIPGLIVETFCAYEDALSRHPFLRQCSAVTSKMEELLQAGPNGLLDRTLSPAVYERVAVLLSHVMASYRYGCTPYEGDKHAVTEDEKVESYLGLCPAGGGKSPTASSRPCPTGQLLMESAIPMKSIKYPSWMSNLQNYLRQKLDRPLGDSPAHAELVLCNWYVDPPSSFARIVTNGSGEVDSTKSAHFTVSFENVQSIQCVGRFLSLPDEEWYRKLQIALDAQGGQIVSRASSMLETAMSSRDCRALVFAMEQLSNEIQALAHFQWQEFERKDSRGDAVMIHRLKKFVAADFTEEEYACEVYMSGSMLLPSLHLVLGLPWPSNKQSALSSYWEKRVVPLLPHDHLKFLDGLRETESVRTFCESQWQRLPIQRLAALEEGFNECIEVLVYLSNMRMRLVHRCFPEGWRHKFKNFLFEEEKALNGNRLQALQMRRMAEARENPWTQVKQEPLRD